MKRLIQISFVLIFLLPAFLNSCKKYEEGPFISFRSKKERIANTWKFDKVIIDDKTEINDPLLMMEILGGNATSGSGLDTLDSTGTFDSFFSNELSNTTLTLEKEGDVKVDLSFISQQIGQWELGAKKETLIIIPDESDTQINMKILKLKEKEMWTLLEDSATYEMHFVDAEENE